MAQPIANVVLSTDLFSTWLTRTNQIAAAISSSVVTANSTLGSTTGNAHIEGALSANTLVASSFLRGGNNSTSNTLVITSNVTANAYLSIANTLTVTGRSDLSGGTNTSFVTVTANLSVGSNVYVNTSTISIGNSSVNTQITQNVSSFPTITISKVSANGSFGSNGNILKSNGNTTYWSTGGEGYTGSAGTTGFTGSVGASGSPGSNGALGYTGSGGLGYTGSAFSNSSSAQVSSLGVGTTASGTAGEIRATNNITAYYSDMRLKIKIDDIKDALNKVKSLSGFYFRPNYIALDMGYEDKVDVGISAQEINAILPEIIAPAPIDETYMTVRYEKIIPLLIEAIKELSDKVDAIQ